MLQTTSTTSVHPTSPLGSKTVQVGNQSEQYLGVDGDMTDISMKSKSVRYCSIELTNKRVFTGILAVKLTYSYRCYIQLIYLGISTNSKILKGRIVI